MEKVTRQNCEKLNKFEHITAKNADGTRIRARRNGKTKVWKTRPNDFQIPVKHGMYDYGKITDQTANMWEGEV